MQSSGTSRKVSHRKKSANMAFSSRLVWQDDLTMQEWKKKKKTFTHTHFFLQAKT